MKNEPAWRSELDELLCAAELGALDEAQNARLNQILREHEGALDTFVAAQEVDALLRWHHGVAKPEPAFAQRPRRGRLLRIASLVAAAAVILTVGFLNWTPVETGTLRGNPEGPLVGGGPANSGEPLVGAPVTGRVAPTQPSRLVQTGNWQIDPQADAEFEITAPGKARLASGELLVRSTAEAPGELSIDTPYGVVRAQGTEFYVGTHESEKGSLTMKRLTRVLVLSGTVALVNSFGDASASKGEFLVAGDDFAPVKGVAQANNSFGIDLLKQLAATEGNLFFSPYSLSLALSMTLEGARGETAQELGRALHVPVLMRRIGDDAQHLPFALGELHNGHQALARLLEEAKSSPGQLALRRRHAELAPQVAELKRRIDELSDAKKIAESNALRRQWWGPRDELAQLERDIASYEVSIANALFGEATYPFAADYLRTLHFAYGTDGLQNVDFAKHPDRERELINEWVSRQTRGLIQDILAPGTIDESTRLALVNAIYFRGNWVEPFKANRTRNSPFTLKDGTEIKVQLMSHEGMGHARYGAFNSGGTFFETPEMRQQGQTEGLYPDDDGFELVEIPYQGNDLSMVMLLPRTHTGLEQLENSLTSEKLARWIAELKQREVYVSMPKFKSQSSFEMRRALESLGVLRAFRDPTQPGGAQFGGMTDSERIEDQLYISSVVHQATITVDEKGSEAAAATVVSVVLAGSSIQEMMPFTPAFQANRPFLYAIRDMHSGTILFLGRMSNPK